VIALGVRGTVAKPLRKLAAAIRMPAAKKGKKAVPDVRSAADMNLLKDTLAAHPLTLVLVYADWCGHCTTYKADTWKNIGSLPNRTVGMAQLNADALDASPLSNAKISGYPSVLLVGKDGKPAEFEEDGEPTNAMPNSRDLDAMTKIATAEPALINSAVAEASGSALKQPPTVEEDISPPFTAAALNARNKSANEMALNTFSGTSAVGTSLSRPDSTEDLLQSQEASSGPVEDPIMTGGSLYRALLDAGSMIAAPAALSLGAVWATRKARRGSSLKKARKARSKRARSLKLRRSVLNTARQRK
jgi:hypothetical protein